MLEISKANIATSLKETNVTKEITSKSNSISMSLSFDLD